MKTYNVLYISPTVPCSSIPHAGGQVAFYYLNKLRNRKDIRLKVISCPPKYETQYIHEAISFFDIQIIVRNDQTFIQKLMNKVNVTTLGFIPNNTYNELKKYIYMLNKSGYVPDFVIFDWEQMCYMFDYIKNIWSSTFFLVIEQDVLSQSLQRFFRTEKNVVKKLYKFINYIRCINKEREKFLQLDEIVVISEKDKLLVQSICSKARVRVISPYYHDYSGVSLCSQSIDMIIFYGFLAREENREAVEWFIKSVMPRLNSKIQFVVIGDGVGDLEKYAGEKIFFTGFLSIEEIANLFSRALCMVVPLFHGAGVKIKVLEAMSAGLPVLTNEIGIEGISARNGLEYIHCEYEEDYVQNISCLSNNTVLRNHIGKNARDMLKKKFNYKECEYIFF